MQSKDTNETPEEKAARLARHVQVDSIKRMKEFHTTEMSFNRNLKLLRELHEKIKDGKIEVKDKHTLKSKHIDIPPELVSALAALAALSPPEFPFNEDTPHKSVIEYLQKNTAYFTALAKVVKVMFVANVLAVTNPNLMAELDEIMKNELGSTHNLASVMVTPNQRIMRYPILLEQIEKNNDFRALEKESLGDSPSPTFRSAAVELAKKANENEDPNEKVYKTLRTQRAVQNWGDTKNYDYKDVVQLPNEANKQVKFSFQALQKDIVELGYKETLIIVNDKMPDDPKGARALLMAVVINPQMPPTDRMAASIELSEQLVANKKFSGAAMVLKIAEKIEGLDSAQRSTLESARIKLDKSKGPSIFSSTLFKKAFIAIKEMAELFDRNENAAKVEVKPATPAPEPPETKMPNKPNVRTDSPIFIDTDTDYRATNRSTPPAPQTSPSTAKSKHGHSLSLLEKELAVLEKDLSKVRSEIKHQGKNDELVIKKEFLKDSIHHIKKEIKSAQKEPSDNSRYKRHAHSDRSSAREKSEDREESTHHTRNHRGPK